MELETKDAKLLAMEQRQATMECDIKEIKTDVKNMPDQIVNRLNESVDMKIKLAITETERKYQAKLIGLLLGMIAEGIDYPVSITLTFYHGDQVRRDSDNQAASIMDLLQDAKVLADDRWQIVRILTI